VLDGIAARHPGLIEKFGGHAMAAGMTLPEANFEKFRSAFLSEIAARADLDSLAGIIHSDGELLAAEFSLETARMLRNAGPWGQGFPEPVFDGGFTITDVRILGGKHLKLQLREAAPSNAAAFAGSAGPAPRPAPSVPFKTYIRTLDSLGGEFMLTKVPGPELSLGHSKMVFKYEDSFHKMHGLEGYERLILEAMLGDQSLFTRSDEIDRLWEVAMPLIDHPPAVEFYEPGSWGPPSIKHLIAPQRWYLPDGKD